LWGLVAAQWYKRHPSKNLESLMRSIELELKKRHQSYEELVEE